MTSPLQKYRKEKHLSQKQIAEKLHAGVNTIGKLERGEIKLVHPLLPAIAEILDTPVSNLIEGYTPDDLIEKLKDENNLYNRKAAERENELLRQIEDLKYELEQKEKDNQNLQERIRDKELIIELQKRPAPVEKKM